MAYYMIMITQYNFISILILFASASPGLTVSVQKNYAKGRVYNFNCPHDSHWHYRQSEFCNTTHPEYMCLQDLNTFSHIEQCRRDSEYLRKGFRFVWRGNLDGAHCSKKRFQPKVYYTSDGSDCIFKKSLCNEIGQIRIQDGSSTSDTRCTCDYRIGYSFVSEPSNPCYCVPFMEDCSCYEKDCPDGYELSPDFKCVRQDEIHGNYYCSQLRCLTTRIFLEKKGYTKEQSKFTRYEVYDDRFYGFVEVVVLIFSFAIAGIVLTIYVITRETENVDKDTLKARNAESYEKLPTKIQKDVRETTKHIKAESYGKLRTKIQKDVRETTKHIKAESYEKLRTKIQKDVRETTKQIKEGDLNVQVFGKDWSDKQYITNTILANYTSMNDSANTDECITVNKVVRNKQITVTNTPDIFSKEDNDDSKNKSKTCQFANPISDVVIFVMKYSRIDNIEDTEFDYIKTVLQKLLGNDVRCFLIFVIAYTGNLTRRVFEKKVEEKPQLQKLLQECENRYCMINKQINKTNRKNDRKKLMTMIELLKLQNGLIDFTTKRILEGEGG